MVDDGGVGNSGVTFLLSAAEACGAEGFAVVGAVAVECVTAPPRYVVCGL
jgi:hypothetical protein